MNALSPSIFVQKYCAIVNSYALGIYMNIFYFLVSYRILKGNSCVLYINVTLQLKMHIADKTAIELSFGNL